MESTSGTRSPPASDHCRDAADKATLIRGNPGLAREIDQLSLEQAVVFVAMVRRAGRKRWILIAGYLLAFVTMVGGMMYSLYRYGTREPGEFVAWVFVLPFFLVAAVLIMFGRWARRQ